MPKTLLVLQEANAVVDLRQIGTVVFELQSLPRWETCPRLEPRQWVARLGHRSNAAKRGGQAMNASVIPTMRLACSGRACLRGC